MAMPEEQKMVGDLLGVALRLLGADAWGDYAQFRVVAGPAAALAGRNCPPRTRAGNTIRPDMVDNPAVQMPARCRAE